MKVPYLLGQPRSLRVGETSQNLELFDDQSGLPSDMFTGSSASKVKMRNLVTKLEDKEHRRLTDRAKDQKDQQDQDRLETEKTLRTDKESD